MTTTNKGDCGYWCELESGKLRLIRDKRSKDARMIIPRRELYATKMKDVIFPGYDDYEGDIVPLDGKDYAYFWWKEGKGENEREELGELRTRGYDFATTDKFKVVWPGFWEEDGRIYNGPRILLACPYEKYRKNKLEEAEFRRKISRLEEQIDEEFAESIARTAREEGIQMEPLTSPPRKAGRK